MKLAFLSLLLFAGSASAQSITPAFTQGSMQSTTTATQTITEIITHELYGSTVSSYSGENVTPSTTITDTAATWTVTTPGDPWSLEVTTRPAGIVETIDINRTINLDSTTTSLSVFSQ